ncbi:MAG: AbrB/MazE/SpoVT family DNA-binding domain-containing protein [Faecalibacterium sp.]|nr:AbrB/MazE/SpoVT family DNA-binding domain-containing protein [Faecalibacterium sp.]
MKSTGIVRGIDNLGRIVLPKELRKALKLDADARLEIFVDGETILLKKYKPLGTCDLCGEITPDALQFKNLCICRACRDELNAL